jgi:WD40 repeat protein
MQPLISRTLARSRKLRTFFKLGCWLLVPGALLCWVWAALGPKAIVFEGHGNVVVQQVLAGPDARTLLSLSAEDGTIRVWDVASRRELCSFNGTYAALTRDGKNVALMASKGDAIRLVDIHSRQQRLLFPGPDHPNMGGTGPPFECSADGKLVAAGTNSGAIRLWDLESGAECTGFPGNGKAVHSLAFSPDAKLLALGSNDNMIRIWDKETGKLCISLPEESWNTAKIDSSCLTFSPDGKTLASRGYQSIKLWDLTNGQVSAALSDPRWASTNGEFVESVAFSPNGKKLVTLFARIVNIWDLTTNRVTDTFTPGDRKQRVRDDFGPVGRAVLDFFPAMLAGYDIPRSVYVSPDGRVWVMGSGGHPNYGVVKMWHLATFSNRP